MKKGKREIRPYQLFNNVLLSIFIIFSVLLLSACQPSAPPSTGGNAATTAPKASTTLSSSGSNAATAAPVVSSTAPTVMATTSSPSGGNPAVTASPAQAGGNQSVDLANLAFNPKDITVPVGTTVVWTNKDNVAHTVTADDKSFDSGNLDPGATFQFTFTKAGTFPYYCHYHGGPNGQGMSGVVTVTGQ